LKNMSVSDLTLYSMGEGCWITVDILLLNNLFILLFAGHIGT